MPSLDLLRTLFREWMTLTGRPRVAEPDLIMDDPDKVMAFTYAGREDGVMAPVYLFHCAHICEVVRPGDLVLDLGCGPATQLGMVARLNPEAQFVGIDLSGEMLQRASAHIKALNLKNVTLLRGDISRLDALTDESVDVVMSTMVLHHLPDSTALERTFKEIRRVVRPAGGLYLADFGRLKSEASMVYFAHRNAERQPAFFTEDYLGSLRAAFTKQEFQRLAKRHLSDLACLRVTFGMPFMMAVKSAARATVNDRIIRELQSQRDAWPQHLKVDLADLTLFFRLGGLSSPCLWRRRSSRPGPLRSISKSK